jgi:undecaprenyl phosphate N,N'-diacetylbacillosamine 1-phosphate transferase
MLHIQIKRMIDIVFSIVGLTVLSPVLIMIALLIKFDSEGPIIFIQKRAGREGKLFEICKFRTMVIDAEKKGAGVIVQKNDTRITRVGQFLRHTSLDELPQLINVIKGEMSLIGPRPTLPYQVERYDEQQRGRLQVRPGVTGWAQVNGRNTLTWPEKIELDLWYIDHWSLWLDLKIIFLTFKSLFLKSSLYRSAAVDPISDPESGLPNNEDKV